MEVLKSIAMDFAAGSTELRSWLVEPSERPAFVSCAALCAFMQATLSAYIMI